MSSAPRAAAASLLLGTLMLGGCRSDTVTIAYRPRPGSHFSYRVDVTATTTTRFADRAPSIAVDHERLDVEETVVAAGPDGADVRVSLRSQQGEEVLAVHYDRADHLTGVQRQDNLPVASLGELGLGDVFPASLDAPPLHRLRPGDSWAIAAPLTLAPTASTVTRGRVTGHGRLQQLTTVGGRPVAVTRTVLEVPIDGRYPVVGGSGTVDVRGGQETTAVATRLLADGVVEAETTDSRGTFEVSAAPPPGTNGAAISGTMSLTVHAATVLTAGR